MIMILVPALAVIGDLRSLQGADLPEIPCFVGMTSRPGETRAYLAARHTGLHKWTILATYTGRSKPSLERELRFLIRKYGCAEATQRVESIKSKERHIYYFRP